MPRPAPVARACPTCGRAFVRLELHTVCPLAPDVHAWLVQNLPDPADPRYIIQARGLDGRDVPITRAVLMRHYGTWRNLAAAFGLRCRTRAQGDKAQLGPDEYAELHRLAQELHGGKHGPSHGEYGVFARNVPRKETGLTKAFGTWSAVLAAAGLPYGTMSEYQRASNARRRAQQVPQNARRSLDRGDEPISREYTGIPVMPKPRQLPSGGVAWTVR